MTPATALSHAKKGELLPIYVVVGQERFLRDQVVSELRAASLGGGVAAFNEDRFTAGETDPDKILAAAKTVPMMAPKRFVLVRNADRWDAGGGDSDDDSGSSKSSPGDKIAAYAQDPVPSTCLVITGEKLDGRRKLASVAKKLGFLVDCQLLERGALAPWIVERCAGKGNPIERDVAEFLAEIAGPELAYISDAIERLALYAGADNAITESAVSECITRVRTADTWALVDAVGARDLGAALRMLADVYDPRDRGLPLLGALAWSIRQLLRLQIAIAAGASIDEAGRRAGVYPTFRARELAAKTKAFKGKELERWLLVLAETDLALKSSRRPADAILEDALTRLCRRA